MNDLYFVNKNDDIVIPEIIELTDKDFEEIETADWDSIYNSLEMEEQRLLDELERYCDRQYFGPLRSV